MLFTIIVKKVIKLERNEVIILKLENIYLSEKENIFKQICNKTSSNEARFSNTSLQ